MNDITTIKNQIPLAVYQKVIKMEPAHQAAFVDEFRRQGKSVTAAYLFWLLGSVTGLHYLYFKKILLWMLFICTIGGLGIWWIIDAFRVGGIVREHNKTVSLSVLQQIQVLN